MRLSLSLIGAGLLHALSVSAAVLPETVLSERDVGEHVVSEPRAIPISALHKRQGTIGSGLAMWAKAVILGETAPDPIYCQMSDYEHEYDGKMWYSTISHKRDDGNTYPIAQVCWISGTRAWGEDDTKVAQCLTDLHMEQAFTCISLKGSSCMAGSSAVGFKNMRLIYSGSLSANQQLGPKNGNRIKNAIETFKGAFSDVEPYGFDMGTRVEITTLNDDGKTRYQSAQWWGRDAPDMDC